MQTDPGSPPTTSPSFHFPFGPTPAPLSGLIPRPILQSESPDPRWISGNDRLEKARTTPPSPLNSQETSTTQKSAIQKGTKNLPAHPAANIGSHLRMPGKKTVPASQESSPPSLLLSLQGIKKNFAEKPAVNQLDLDVEEGEIVALLGPSGCGKTTTLRLIAGFERADEGTIRLAGKLVESPETHVPPERRQIGMVFQDYALFPHLNVAENIAFGLTGRRRARRQSPRVDELLSLVDLEEYKHRRPHQLSGGQQQRVALARALAPHPTLILLDEPFSNLDTTLRQKMRAEVQNILRKAGATAIFVTHSREEAFSMADRVAVMQDGRVIQAGSPADLYHRPTTPFVASFLADATVIETQQHAGRAETPWGMVRLPSHQQQIARCTLAIRPESVVLFSAETPDTHDSAPPPAGNSLSSGFPTRPELQHIENAEENTQQHVQQKTKEDAQQGNVCTVIDQEYHGHDELVTIAGKKGAHLRARLRNEKSFAVGSLVRAQIHLTEHDIFPP